MFDLPSAFALTPSPVSPENQNMRGLCAVVAKELAYLRPQFAAYDLLRFGPRCGIWQTDVIRNCTDLDPL
jgi:hypothetical protein